VSAGPADRADVVWTPEGPRSTRFDDIYHAADGLAEARTVFLRGCGLPEGWAGRSRFVVAELGFGTGLNVLALLQLWRERRPPGGRLHVFSVEAHPLSAEAAARALAAFPELSELARPLLAAWPGRARGYERIEFADLGAVLDVATAEAAEALAAWDGLADAWFLDGFAPSRNPEMWRPEVLDLAAARSRPGARLATFTVAGAVRRGLQARGFALTRAPGHGRKKERLEARLGGEAIEAPAPASVAIVGGGIAGAALARAFARLGLRARLFDPEPGAGASGNPAALTTPRLDAGGGAAARLGAQAFARAVDLYAEVPGATVSRGVLKLATDARDAERHRVLAASPWFRAGTLEALGPEEAADRLGEPCAGGLWLAEAPALAPKRVLARWLQEADIVRTEVAGLERTGTGWRLLDAGGAAPAEAEVVCLAAGAGAERWAAGLELVAGQASWTHEAEPPGAAASWGGYLAPLDGGGVLFGATHERGEAAPVASAAADGRNLETLRSRAPGLAGRLDGRPLQGRASVRAATADRLPLAGELEPGLFVLGGLGGRGFGWAPLLAEHVAARAMGAPSPLPLDAAAAVDPARFAARAERRRAAGRSTAQAGRDGTVG